MAQLWSYMKKRKIGLVAGAVVGGVGCVVAAPLVIAGLGFGAGGIAAGSMAASMMSSAAIANGGAVAAGSLVAVLQSVGAVGLGVAGAAAVGAGGAAVGVVAGGAIDAAVDAVRNKPPNKDGEAQNDAESKEPLLNGNNGGEDSNEEDDEGDDKPNGVHRKLKIVGDKSKKSPPYCGTEKKEAINVGDNSNKINIDEYLGEALSNLGLQSKTDDKLQLVDEGDTDVKCEAQSPDIAGGDSTNPCPKTSSSLQTTKVWASEVSDGSVENGKIIVQTSGVFGAVSAKAIKVNDEGKVKDPQFQFCSEDVQNILIPARANVLDVNDRQN